MPEVEPWQKNKEELRDAESNLKDYNNNSDFLFWPETTSDKKIANNSTVRNITSSININGGVLGNGTI